MRILLFGRLKEVVGLEEVELDSASDLKEVKDLLFKTFPSLKKEVFTVAVNGKIAQENRKISEGDEIALIPPVSGG
jgi:molybdopterin synthase sulfur carrier subunit